MRIRAASGSSERLAGSRRTHSSISRRYPTKAAIDVDTAVVNSGLIIKSSIPGSDGDKEIDTIFNLVKEDEKRYISGLN